MSHNYATKYRPQDYSELVGQSAAKQALEGFDARGYPHAFLFTGESGVGKTTSARIVARKVGTAPEALREINAANYTGVDSWREVLHGLRFAPLVGDATFIIVDECHMLSKSSWNVLLKPTEDIPKHVYWAFCTTEPGKVPKTIKTRCTEIPFRAVQRGQLRKLVERVAQAEGLDLPEGVDDLVIEYAEGSPRQALTGLQAVAGADGVDEARDLLQAPDLVNEAVDLARTLFSTQPVPTWGKAMDCLAKIESPNAEAVRRVVEAYGVAVCRKKHAGPRELSILDAFAVPYPSGTTSIAPLLISIGKVFYDAQ